MTKKKKISPSSKYNGITFKVEETVLLTQPKLVPVNLAEEKEKFIKFGTTPKFEVRDPSKLNELAEKTKNQIRFDLQSEAVNILEQVRNDYGDGEYFLEHAFGPRITKEEATPILLQYISENSLSESLTIHWCDNLVCSAKMVWKGPLVNCNRPELRKYSLWINGSEENNYMRESGIRCLMDHEIGTHFCQFRMLNDGFQPWYADRAKFGLRLLGAFEGQCTEEGLATINTCLRGRVKLLWGAALAYYTACKSAEMTFRQLFDHIGRYTSNPDYRWKQVMRVKRGLADPNDLGGFGNDQCYFEGAVNILRGIDKIDFHLLMSGKICYDELDRIKRIVRKDSMRYPTFMHNMAAYRKALKKMATINGLDKVYPIQSAPVAYLRRLDERRACITGNARKESKKVRSKANLNSPKCKTNTKQRKSKKKNEEDENCEIASFTVTQPFVNMHYQKQENTKKAEETNEIYRSLENISSSLSSLENTVDKQIQELKGIVKEHSWSSSDNGYKEGLLRQAFSELSGDSLLMYESLRTGSALDNSAKQENSYEEIRPKTSFMDYKSDQIIAETSLANLKGAGRRAPLKLDPILKSDSNSNANNCGAKKLGKKLVPLPSHSQSKSINPLPKSKKKKEEEPFTQAFLESKMKQMSTLVQSQIKPDEIVGDLKEINHSLSKLPPEGTLVGKSNFHKFPLLNHIDNVKQQGRKLDTLKVNRDFHSESEDEVIQSGTKDVCSESGNGVFQSGTKLMDNKNTLNLQQQCSSIILDSNVKSKLLRRQSSLSFDFEATDPETVFFFDRPFYYGSDSSQSTPTPREKRKKNPWANIVSQYAQRKPILIKKAKLDREFLKADLCQPFFIQAEQILRAQNLLQKSSKFKR